MGEAWQSGERRPSGSSPKLSGRLRRVLPRSLFRFLKRSHHLIFFGTFDTALKAVRVNSETFFWIREFVLHLPGGTGLAYRSCFYNHYFKCKGESLTIQVGVCIEYPQGLEMGDNVLLNRNVWLNAIGGLKIGSYCGFGPGVVIHTSNHNYKRTDVPWAEQGANHKPVTIEDDVWLGASVTVVPGTKIGRGAVIAAGATVVGTVEPYTIMAGIPARKIGERPRDTAEIAAIENP